MSLINRRKPLIDLTTLYGVESLFHSQSPDPWARQLAGKLTDFVIYADVARYALPMKDLSVSEKDVTLPSLLQELKYGEPNLFRPEILLTDECGDFNVKFLKPSVKPFVSWAKSNRDALTRWTKLHNESWIRGPHKERLPRRYAIPVQELKANQELIGLARTLKMPKEDVWYTLDVILRYPTYGKIAGKQDSYLNHSIRDAFSLPTMKEERVAVRQAVSFEKSVASFVDTLTQPEYIKLLLKLREQVRKNDLHEQKPGEFDVEVIRKIAGNVGIPGHLKLSKKLIPVAGGLVTGLGAIPAFGLGVSLVGGAISVAGALWPGKLPRVVSKIQWLRWAIEWPELEGQAKVRK